METTRLKTINWEPLRLRLVVVVGNSVSYNWNDAIDAVTELKNRINEIALNKGDFALFLSAFIPIFSSILALNNINDNSASYTAAYSSQQSNVSTLSGQKTIVTIEQQNELRYMILQVIRSMPMNEILRIHAPHLIAVAMDLLLSNTNLNGTVMPYHNPVQSSSGGNISCEENAVQAAHIIFDLYKQYRTLPQDDIQTFLDFVVSCYKALPSAVQNSFTKNSLMGAINQMDYSSSTENSNLTPDISTKANISAAEASNSARASSTPLPFIGAPFSAALPAVSTMSAEKSGEVQQQQSPSISTLEASKIERSVKLDDFQKDASEPSTIQKPSKQSTTFAFPSDFQTPSPTQQQFDLLSPENPTSTVSPSAFRSSSNTTYFRVLTECPLIVMLMFQLYPRFGKTNIPVLIRVMIEALGLRVPPIHLALPTAATSSVPNPTSASPSNIGNEQGPIQPNATDLSLMDVSDHDGIGSSTSKLESGLKRLYFSRTRELIAAQAKTLSFLTYLLRSYANELKPYEDRIATNVVALMTSCPRESISTRKELLVATRHLLNNNDFRKGFYKHVDTLLDARILMGSSSHYHYYHHYCYNSASYRFSDQTMLRPLGYATLSDLIQHVRQGLTMSQISRVVSIFSRVLHDSSISMTPLPLSTQYSAVRTLIGLSDQIFNNKDPNPQIGRDMLCRMLETLVDKLQALNEYFPAVLDSELKREALESSIRVNLPTTGTSQSDFSAIHTSMLSTGIMSPPDCVRDVQSMIRAIVVGVKSIVYFLNSYRSQREKDNNSVPISSATSGPDVSNPTMREQMMPPSGSNEEVASAMLKLTATEISIIDRYILSAMPAMKLIKVSSSSLPSSVSNTEVTRNVDISIGKTRDTLGSTSNTTNIAATEKTLSDNYRDALTHFAAAFSSLDGYNLRRTIGKRIELLVDAIVDDPMVMVVPRHLLAFSRISSFEFCNILMDYLCDRMNMLAKPKNNDTVVFLEESHARCPPEDDADVSSPQMLFEKKLHMVSMGPSDSEARKKQRSLTILHLFERVLKSLSTYPENETVVRRHLRRIVVFSFRSAMENTDDWPENYCMLLRYIFRSISAGKFEDSYKELLPLIPSVLNGLYRVLISTCNDDNKNLRYTAMELCLTIPARLSSLLPHISLLLRIIIPALDSNLGDLVNLGLRTLEFWVDNLNPLFLYPEISKELELFSRLMQSLTRHLRPAPYPYGLLTLRLLGKLGGNNRKFLRHPMVLSYQYGKKLPPTPCPPIYCSYSGIGDSDVVMQNTQISFISESLPLPIPLSRCLEMIKMIATASPSLLQGNEWESESYMNYMKQLWDIGIEELDIVGYKKVVIASTLQNHAWACFDIVFEYSQRVLGKPPVDCVDSHLLNAKANIEFNRPGDLKVVYIFLCYACMIDTLKEKATSVLTALVKITNDETICQSLSEFLSVPVAAAADCGQEFLLIVLREKGIRSGQSLTLEQNMLTTKLIGAVADSCRSNSWSRLRGLREAILYIMNFLGAEWCRQQEIAFINVALLSIKAVPRELSRESVKAVRFCILVCTNLYGTDWMNRTENEIVFDSLISVRNLDDIRIPHDEHESTMQMELEPKKTTQRLGPSEATLRVVIFELAAPQQLVRFAARFLLANFLQTNDFLQSNMSLIRRVLFSRALRLLPLPQQVGVVEGLAMFVKQHPGLLPLSDQHVLAFISELLKMLSVGDGDMTDAALKDHTVGKDGYVASELEIEHSTFLTHSSSIFFRRDSFASIGKKKIVVTEELPAGVQLRVSAIILLHSIILSHTEDFFDAEWVGNIRPHVISLFFRSLVAKPPAVVNAAHQALRDVLSFRMVSKPNEGSDSPKSQFRLPKELVQTCIRPVLLHLKDYTHLSPALLRGLARLITLLSSWFNKTLGEKLLDHLQKWTEPSHIAAQKRWREGEEPFVAAKIVGIFPSLQNASHFVEPLVKTCIKLEASLFRARLIDSPFRRPLARYLAKHAQYTVSFFFQRLKTPMYSELFQFILQCEESETLRSYLCSKKCSAMILNVCFERPLAIIRSEKSSSSGVPSKNSLFVHGIGKAPTIAVDSGISAPRPMNIETLELQLQGFRIVNTLLTNNIDYFREHNDIIRALRWLWRSKGRFLRLQHEDLIPTRYHGESKILAAFLLSYAKSHPAEDLDILFELIRLFLQPSTSDFSFVSSFLTEMVTNILTLEQKKKVLQRFFVLVAGENEEIKVLSIQFLIFPMLSFSAFKSSSADVESIIDGAILEKFVNDVLFQEGNPIICGDRLLVELLRLLCLFSQYCPSLMNPFRNEATRFYWGLLKSEDTSCKSWAYIVACRFIVAFDTPSTTVVSIYFALLRLHQQEGKDLVRLALNIIVPALPKRLSKDDFENLIHKTSQMMLEDINSTHLLAQICQTIVRNPDVFSQNRIQFQSYMILALDRFGISTNSLCENRQISLDIVELFLEWNAIGLRNDDSPKDTDVIINFLVRLKLAMAENPDIKNQQWLLERRVNKLLEDTLRHRPHPLIRVEPLENILKKDQKSSGPLIACLQLCDILCKNGLEDFLTNSSGFVHSLLAISFQKCREDECLRKELGMSMERLIGIGSFNSTISYHLEKILHEVTEERSKHDALGCPENDKPIAREKVLDENIDAAANYVHFALVAMSKLSKHQTSYLKKIFATLLMFYKSFASAHYSDASARHRQGSSNSSRSLDAGTRHHTPTVGILDSTLFGDDQDNSKVAASKNRKDDKPISPCITCLSLVLRMLESSEDIYNFTRTRKEVLQILIGVIDNSDSLLLLLVAVRYSCRLILSNGYGSPLTLKEKNSLLSKLALLDFNWIQDDLLSQALSDIVITFILRFCQQNITDSYKETEKLIVAFLPKANLAARDDLLRSYVTLKPKHKGLQDECEPSNNILLRLLRSDFEGIGGRFWVIVFVEVLLWRLNSDSPRCINGIRVLIHSDMSFCHELLEQLLPIGWEMIQDDRLRFQAMQAIESLLSRTYHNQFSLTRNTFFIGDSRCTNAIRSFLNAISVLRPIPILDTNLLVYLAEQYSSWHEVIALLELQYFALNDSLLSEQMLTAMRHCYRKLNEEDMWLSVARESCNVEKSRNALSLDVYSLVEGAVAGYSQLVDLVESAESNLEPSNFEMDMWEERWILLQKELCQGQVLSEFACASANPHLQLECAWKSQDWAQVRTLCSSTALLAGVESGDPSIKISETLLAIADGKLAEVENLHAQSAQLCLYKWQLFPKVSCGSMSHASLFQLFHRLVEIRESGNIMSETTSHASKKTLPDLKNILNSWRHRLPNDWERMSTWDEIFSWRSQMFSAIASNFHWVEPNTLASLQDRPWSSIRMAKTARKQGMRDVGLLLLNRTSDERAMNVSDAFQKLREQIVAYYNLNSDLERHGGLNLINTTNLSFFDAPQKSELFRLKALFLYSLGGRSKANQAYCHSVQICPTNAKAWGYWGELCGSLGALAEKQIDQSASTSGSVDSKEAKANSAKKVAQYLAQAMGCYFEAMLLDSNEWVRIHIAKCLWMLSKDGSAPGVLCQTFESRGAKLPAWMWLPWLPTLLTSLYRREGKAVKTILSSLIKMHPQAIYYPLRAFYLERRDVERGQSSGSSPQNHGSVLLAEELMSLLRRSHASLWSSLESILEELTVKFKPSYEEELLSTVIALQERVEAQVGAIGNKDVEESVVHSVWKTLKRIAVKFFRTADHSSFSRDTRAKKTAQFKETYKDSFETDFYVTSADDDHSPPDVKLEMEDILRKLRKWKLRLEDDVLLTPNNLSLIETSHSLSIFGVGDAPDLWPGACDAGPYKSRFVEVEVAADTDSTALLSTTSSSVHVARKAANTAALAVAEAAAREGAGGDYGGGSALIEVPGQYMPNSSSFSDIRPNPELHAKVLRFDSRVDILRRSDQLVRRIGVIASDGHTYRFLLQFAVPYLTRTDERTCQTSFFLDKIFRKDIRSSRLHLSIQSLPVIPVAQRLRLISEPESKISLESVCELANVDSSKYTQQYNDEVKMNLVEKVNTPMTDVERSNVEKSIRKEAYMIIRRSFEHDNMLSSHIQKVLNGYEALYHFRRVFAQQWAVNCLLQYVFSATERTPGRVSFIENTGRVLSLEFRTSYGSQGYMEKMPLPFRFTTNLVSLIGKFLIEARFIPSFSIAANAVHDCRDDIEAVWKLLMRDDLVAFYTKAMAKTDLKTVEMEKQLVERVTKNVATLNSRFAECIPITKTLGDDNDVVCDKRVRDLIDLARNPDSLCMMSGNYQAWL